MNDILYKWSFAVYVQVHQNCLPPSICDSFKYREQIHSHNTRSVNKIQIPQLRKNAQRTIISLWELFIIHYLNTATYIAQNAIGRQIGRQIIYYDENYTKNNII